MKPLKDEDIHTNNYGTFDGVMIQLRRSIEQVYNGERLHSAPGYQSPQEFEALHSRQAA